jgi:HPt (histidine-containing phosphotransfer) domain-containing protein
MNNKLTFLKNKGFDLETGLSYLGDEAMYEEILADFKNGFINQMAEIRKTFESADWENYVILVHALKSNCRTLGITSLATLAYDHELKGKEQNITYIKEHVTELFTKANEIYLILDEAMKM